MFHSKLVCVKTFCSLMLLGTICSMAIAEDGDKISLRGDLGYDTNAGVGGKWIIASHVAIPDGKFLRVTFSYEYDGVKNEVITVLSGRSKQYMQYLTIVSLPNSSPMIYFNIVEQKFPKIQQFCDSMSIKDVNVLELFCLQSMEISMDQEIVLASTREVSGHDFFTVKKIAYPLEEPVIKRLPVIEFHLRFSTTSNKFSYMMKRDLDANIKNLSIEEKLKYLEAEQARRMQFYNQGFAAVGDINIGQAYLTRIKTEILLQEAEKGGSQVEIQKVKDSLVQVNKDLERFQQ